jgi:hypothetical protein
MFCVGLFVRLNIGIVFKSSERIINRLPFDATNMSAIVKLMFTEYNSLPFDGDHTLTAPLTEADENKNE